MTNIYMYIKRKVKYKVNTGIKKVQRTSYYNKGHPVPIDCHIKHKGDPFIQR